MNAVLYKPLLGEFITIIFIIVFSIIRHHYYYYCY